MTEQDVIGQMLAAGLDAPAQPLVLNGNIQRWGRKDAHWYSLREMRTDGGTHVVVGSFGDWRTGLRQRVDVDWKGLRDDERAALESRRQADAAAREAERVAAAAEAAMSAAELWAGAARSGSSPYLERKLVVGEGCRYLRGGAIVVPLLRYDEHDEQGLPLLKAVQLIRPDGTKRFTRGFEKPRACLVLGPVIVGEPILVAEGYATALTLRMAVQRRLPVVVALDAGNLQPVAEMLRERYGSSKLLICADDDHQTAGNPGRHKAHLASREVSDCAYVWPVFHPANRGAKDTDFNDLHAREGITVVRRQLRHVLPLLGSEILNAVA
ncbi:MAG: hypothetical protein RLZZ524_1045 [Pseudomonadota bacterium]